MNMLYHSVKVDTQTTKVVDSDHMFNITLNQRVTAFHFSFSPHSRYEWSFIR